MGCARLVVRGRGIHGLSRPIPVEGLGQEFGWVQVLVDPELVHVQSSVAHLGRIGQLRVMSHSPTQLIARVRTNRKNRPCDFKQRPTMLARKQRKSQAGVQGRAKGLRQRSNTVLCLLRWIEP